jgi:hypothetical protein
MSQKIKTKKNDSPVKSSGPEVFFMGRFLTTLSVSKTDKKTDQVIYFFLSEF